MADDLGFEPSTPNKGAAAQSDADLGFEEAPKAPGAASRFGGSIYDSMIGGIVDTLKRYAWEPSQRSKQAAENGDWHELVKEGLMTVLPGAAMATDIVKGSYQQGKQAITQAKAGQYGPAALSAVGAVPIVGPMVQKPIQQFSQGDVAGGLGTTAGNVLMLAGPELLKASPAADLIRADMTPTDLLAQTTKKGKAILARSGDDVTAAGYTGPAPAVKAQAAADIKRLGPQIGTEEAKLDASGVNPDVQQLHNDIQALRDANSRNGVPLNDAYDARLVKAQDKILDMGSAPGAPVKYSDLNALKQEWQSEASGTYLDPSAKGAAKGAKAAAAATRNVLENMQGTDAINAINEQFSNAKAAFDLASLAKPKLHPLVSGLIKAGSAAAGETAGHMVGMPVVGGLVGLTTIAPALEKSILSGSLRTAPAAIRNSIADAIASGDLGRANRLAILAGQGIPPAKTFTINTAQ